jgi:hypothetical protein
MNQVNQFPEMGNADLSEFAVIQPPRQQHYRINDPQAASLRLYAARGGRNSPRLRFTFGRELADRLPFATDEGVSAMISQRGTLRVLFTRAEGGGPYIYRRYHHPHRVRPAFIEVCQVDFNSPALDLYLQGIGRTVVPLRCEIHPQGVILYL